MPEMQEKGLCNCAQLPAFLTRILPIVTLMAKPTRPLWLAPLTYLVLFAALWYSCQRPSETPQPKQISYSEFLSEVRKGHVAEVRIDEQLFIATLKTDAGKKEAAQQISAQRLPGIDETPLLKDLEAPECNFLRPYHQVFVVESVASPGDTGCAFHADHRLRQSEARAKTGSS